jgi:transposase
MQKEQKTYTKEFKVEAVRLLESSQKSQAQIARELGVADSTLSQWRKDVADHGHDAFPGSGHQTPLEEENRHLKREVEVLRQEREILKKAISIFSRGQGCAYQFVAEHQGEYPIALMCQVRRVFR